MVLIKILKRKDAASVLVAVVIAIIIAQALASASFEPAYKLASIGTDAAHGFGTPSGGWRVLYLQPLLSVLISLAIFELLARVYLFFNMSDKPSTPKK